MSKTKTFPTGDVLSTITGYLVTPNGIGAVYQVLNWMTGNNVYTHQLPRIGREARPVLIAAHPELAAACSEAQQVTQELATMARDLDQAIWRDDRRAEIYRRRSSAD